MSESLYSMNAQRDYPLDDAATSLDDSGIPLPTNILLDCSLRFPEELGKSAYVSAVTITPTLVTILFEAATTLARPSLLDAPAGPSSFTPLGGISIQPPFTTGVCIPIVPDRPGVGGWVVLGTGALRPYRGRFSTSEQSGLALRCARGYRQLPVRSISRRNASGAMTGTIGVVAGTDIAVTSKTVQVGANAVRTIAMRLFSESTSQNPLQVYAGPCGARPESGTCDPPPIEQINSAVPDASGNLLIVFQESIVYPYRNHIGGLAIDVPVTTTAFCNRDFDFDFDNPLPWERPEDDCGDHERFSNSPPQLTIDSGLFSSSQNGFTAHASEVLSVAVQDRTPWPKRIRALFELPRNPDEVRANGGIVFGYRNTETDPTYYLALVDLNLRELAIYSVTNKVPTKLAFEPLRSSFGSAVNTSFTPVVELRVAFGEPAADKIREIPANEQIRVTIDVAGPLAVGNLAHDVAKSEGKFGVGTLYSTTLFKELHAEDEPNAG